MGPFFCSKKEIPAKPKQLINFNFFKLIFETPPSATTGILLKRDSNLNLLIPK